MAPPDELLKKLLARGEPKKPVTTRRKRTKEAPIDTTRLGELCESELVLIAHSAGHAAASRQLLREDLISLILGELNDPVDALETPRRLLHEFVKKHPVMVSQMPCGLDCPHCDHHTVVECFVSNRDLIEKGE
jgi:hypothetical protein